MGRELIMKHKELSSQIDTYTDKVENEKYSLALTMKRNSKLLERSKLLTTRMKVDQLRKQSEMKRFSKGKAEKREEYDVLREPLIESYLQWTSTAMANGPIEEAFMTEDRMDDVSTFELLGFMEVVAKKIALYKKEHDEKKEGENPIGKVSFAGETTFEDSLERTRDPEDENGLEAAEQLSEILNGPE